LNGGVGIKYKYIHGKRYKLTYKLTITSSALEIIGGRTDPFIDNTFKVWIGEREGEATYTFSDVDKYTLETPINTKD
jgi:hypothetical protein